MHVRSLKHTHIHTYIHTHYRPLNDEEEQQVRDVVKGLPKGSTKRGKVRNNTTEVIYDVCSHTYYVIIFHRHGGI